MVLLGRAVPALCVPGRAEGPAPVLTLESAALCKALHSFYDFLGTCEHTVHLLVGNGTNENACSAGSAWAGLSEETL